MTISTKSFFFFFLFIYLYINMWMGIINIDGPQPFSFSYMFKHGLLLPHIEFFESLFYFNIIVFK
jgi:hypothetical protein